MKIILKDISKRYNNEWIFKNLNYEFNSNSSYVMLGANGMGKSTLLQLIAGNILPSRGQISYFLNNISISDESIFLHLTVAAPYMELLEELTLIEAIKFHSHFKPFITDYHDDKIVDLLGFTKSKGLQIKYYSSGMKQRVRLALAILSKTPLLLLDEPLTNLDRDGIEWYLNLMNDPGIKQERLVIVCSNQREDEYSFCDEELNIEDYR